MVEESSIEIKSEPAKVEASRIIQPGAKKVAEPTGRFVEAVMTPVKPTGLTFPKTPKAKGIRSLLVDIETSGASPTNSELICIGYMDADNPKEGAKVIIGKPESEILIDFLDVFVRGGFNRIIAYNAVFDYRYIFSRMLYYRIAAKEFAEVKLYDLMQVMEQVKEAFVYGYNKPGKLDDWATYLLGMSKPLTFKDLLRLWKKKDLDGIEEYNRNDVKMEYYLYSLIELTIQTPYSGASFASPPPRKAEKEIAAELTPSSLPAEVTEAGPTYTARCPICMSEIEVAEDKEPPICSICGAKMIKKEVTE